MQSSLLAVQLFFHLLLVQVQAVALVLHQAQLPFQVPNHLPQLQAESCFRYCPCCFVPTCILLQIKSWVV